MLEAVFKRYVEIHINLLVLFPHAAFISYTRSLLDVSVLLPMADLVAHLRNELRRPRRWISCFHLLYATPGEEKSIIRQAPSVSLRRGNP